MNITEVIKRVLEKESPDPEKCQTRFRLFRNVYSENGFAMLRRRANDHYDNMSQGKIEFQFIKWFA